MIVGTVIALGFGLTILGGTGAMAISTELYPNKRMVALFSILFLVGMGMVGGGFGATS